MAERLLAPKDVAKILGVGYEKAVLLMRSMRRINISTNPASCRPRYVVTESELTKRKGKGAGNPAHASFHEKSQGASIRRLFKIPKS